MRRRPPWHHPERETLGEWVRWSSGCPWRPGPLPEFSQCSEPIFATLVSRTSKNRKCHLGSQEPNREAAESGSAKWTLPSPNRGEDIWSPPRRRRPSIASAPTVHRTARDASSSLYSGKNRQYRRSLGLPRGEPSCSRGRIPRSLFGLTRSSPRRPRTHDCAGQQCAKKM